MTDTAKLKAAALAATPGRFGDRIDGSGSIKYRCVGADGSLVLLTDHKNNEYGFVGENGEADELFFRLCTPESVLELIAALEAAEERYEDMLRQARSFREAHDSASELIRKMEGNKPTVKLPKMKLWAGKIACYEESDVVAMLEKAGINIAAAPGKEG
ncbi:hypothetical protein [Cronobacter muytjensii]|uniref:hypothetical protein n=1 Tax=Cronobacter muytjensii TaxID=413501 RepID=UPI0029F8FF5A|nr:hypothetical protein [Cronobacter muytjensii]